ncbi:nucleotidyltransferase domain-containing protein [Evansella sp. AB-P1]|uniref:nucleotidyltransferase domain-containing protein n=1 Tax=Evansella sp. AB-P1 TaxID=3037653 RepID=UPI00241C826E|nr:nucleotidyltransferase domain-containing protein [Evansella sp. AB-P1]MDG5789240.1 nucleotidyltransferase domain-containing protein [Evansella sp. AB-P1]
MRISGQEAARKFVSEHHEKADIVLLAGSAAKGQETETSDLDMVIINDSEEPAYRESYLLYDWKIETFVHSPNSVLNQYETDKQTGRPILANMIAEGIVLKDKRGKAPTMKNNAKAFLDKGPAPLTESFIQASRYFMFDLLEDFQDAKNRQEALISLNTITIQFIDFMLRVNDQWSGRGKGLSRALKKFDEKLYHQFFTAIDDFYKNGNKQPVIQFVHDFYEPLGGQLFHGFRQDG